MYKVLAVIDLVVIFTLFLFGNMKGVLVVAILSTIWALACICDLLVDLKNSPK